MADLARLEAAVSGRREDRVEVMLETLADIAATQNSFFDSDGGDSATRAATAIGAILSDAELDPTPEDCRRLWPPRPIVQYLFGASAFGSADHLLRAMGLPAFGRAGESLAEATRRLILLGLDSELDFDPLAILDLPPEARQLAFASLISSEMVVTRRGEARRNALLGEAGRIEPAPLPPGLGQLVMVANAWLLCSYGSHPDKHRIKAVLNQSLRRHLGSLGLTDRASSARGVRPGRPTILVAAEVMKSTHVQYRYFGQYLRQLRTRFRLVLVTDESQVDEPVQALFDEVLTFRRKRDGAHLNRIAETIAGCAPDILFWPSVGMAEWGPPLANLRLAPIQLVGLGHSASTFSAAIDYFLLEEGYVGDPALFSETLILLPDSSLRFERSPGFRPAPVRIRDSATPLRVAIPANIAKLNAGFLATLERIGAAAGRPLEYHFLPSARRLAYEALRPRLLARFPGARVHPTLPHNLYRAALTACDLTLSPFPFGGLHSVVDSLQQCLPVVAMEGDQPHSRTDSMLLRRLGMPDWLIAGDEAEYEAAALRIIGSDELRVELSRMAVGLDLDTLLFGDGQGPLGREVIDAVWWIYENHEAIQASGRKAWSAADRVPLQAAVADDP